MGAETCLFSCRGTAWFLGTSPFPFSTVQHPGVPTLSPQQQHEENAGLSQPELTRAPHLPHKPLICQNYLEEAPLKATRKHQQRPTKPKLTYFHHTCLKWHFLVKMASYLHTAHRIPTNQVRQRNQILKRLAGDLICKYCCP